MEMENMKTLLADCLRENADGYVVQSLITEFPTLKDLVNASEHEIKLIKGIGVVKARQLSAILDFAKAVREPMPNKRVIINSPKDAYDLTRSDLEFLQVEQFMVMGLNTKNHVLFKEIIGSGTLNSCPVHPREAFKLLVKRAAASCIFLHNHPSCDVKPSQEDIILTKKLAEAGDLLQIQVLDHIIVGQGRKYASLKELGYI